MIINILKYKEVDNKRIFKWSYMLPMKLELYKLIKKLYKLIKQFNLKVTYDYSRGGESLSNQ